MKWPYVFEATKYMKDFYTQLVGLFKNVGDDMQEQKSRVDNLITNNSQPSEVVDMRTGRDGDTYPVARDMVLGELAKTETAQAQVNQDTASQLAEKVPQINYDADRSYFEARINALTSQWGQAYPTFNDLYAAHPENDGKLHPVNEDDNWYFWLDGSGWTSGGDLNTVLLADGSIHYRHLASDLDVYLKNIYSDVSTFVGTFGVGNRFRINNDPIKQDGYLKRVSVHASGGDTDKSIWIKILDKNEDGTFNAALDFTVQTTVSGNNVFLAGEDFPPDVYVKKGQYIGIYYNQSIVSNTDADTNFETYWLDSNPTGSNITLSTTLGIKYSIEYLVVSDLEDFKALKDSYKRVTSSSVKSFDGKLTSLTRTKFNNDPMKMDGWLDSIILNIKQAGTIKVKIFSQNEDNTFNIEKEFEFNVPEVGTYTFKDGVDFDPVKIEAGWFIGVYSNTASISHRNAEGYLSYSFIGDANGSNLSFIPETGFEYAIEYGVRSGIFYDVTSLSEQINNVKSKIDLIPSAEFDSKTIYETEDFSSDFTKNSFTSTSDGLQSPSAYDVAYWGENTTNEKVETRVRVKINDMSSRFALMRKTPYGFGGTVAEVDCGNKKLNFYADWNGTSQPSSILASQDIPFDFVSGREYLVELIKDVNISKLKITDVISLETAELSFDQETSGGMGVGRQWGNPGIMFFSGDILIKKFEYVSLITRKPKLLIIGDSFVEMWNMVGGFDKKYSSLIRDELHDVVVCGRGGATAATTLTRIDADLKSFAPQYVLIQLGTNDSNGTFETYLANISQIINAVLNMNAIPILVTLPPKPDTGQSAVVTTINNFVKTSGYKYIDFATVLTLNGDGVTWDPSVVQTDGVHPNDIGHERMFEKAQIDAPFLFD